jgi:outer membrane lipoprotein-sorting protein
MRRSAFITVTAILFSLSFSAQTGSAQTVDEIIAKSIAAQGGLAKLRAVQTLRMTGDIEGNGMQAAFTQVYRRPMKTRLDIIVQGLTLTQAYDGQNGWQVVPFTGKSDPEPMTPDDLKRVQEQADFDGPLVDYKKKGNTVELIGKEKIGGADAYHLRVTLQSGDVRDLYLDAGTFLISRAVVKTAMRGSEVELESTLGDYKEVGGMMFPFSIEQHPVGEPGPSQKITFKKIEPNAPVTDSVFKMPSAGSHTAPGKTGPAPK